MGVFAIRELNIPPSLADINSEDSLVFGFIYYLTITKRGHLCATCNIYFGRRHLQMFTNIYSSSKYSFTVVRYHYSAVPLQCGYSRLLRLTLQAVHAV